MLGDMPLAPQTAPRKGSRLVITARRITPLTRTDRANPPPRMLALCPSVSYLTDHRWVRMQTYNNAPL
ncbi:hypothetical protein CH063_02152 [Colletotrichum higginsianum]|uniref:Uncharacterized protein n=1 Tax=Colletotrichum higginsianum (strain IMI 349063) TaxID=759273 RepID=H1VH37_COLHI|nr:hypothetical protein CH063_02152 [Colletotrichum higginsianum]